MVDPSSDMGCNSVLEDSVMLVKASVNFLQRRFRLIDWELNGKLQLLLHSSDAMFS